MMMCRSFLLTCIVWLPVVYGTVFTVHQEHTPSDESLPDTNGYQDTSTTTTTTLSSWSEHNDRNGLDFLVAIFFFIAAAWLVLALVYSILILIVVRLRARGLLDIYDEQFGRLYLVGNRCYLPLGCLLRRYVISLTQEENGGGDTPGAVRIMTRDERRMAVELLLASSDEENVPIRGDSVSRLENMEEDEEAVRSSELEEEIGHADQFAEHGVDDASSEEPVCTICLAEYGMWFR